MFLKLILLLSIIRNAFQMTQFQKIGFAKLVKHQEKDEEASARADNIVLLDLEPCLIM